jgi:Fe(3+) dicitrate transport protein
MTPLPNRASPLVLAAVLGPLAALAPRAASAQPPPEPAPAAPPAGPATPPGAAAPPPAAIEVQADPGAAIDVDVGPPSALPPPVDPGPPGEVPGPTPPPQPPEPLDVFIAGARAKETTGSAHLVSTKQLERFEQDDPHKVLLGVPGVYVRGEDGFGLRPNIGMRGALSDRSKKVTLMEDGVLFAPAPYSAPAAYYFPLITRMTAVRVVKGPSAIAYGPHTVAGAIDFVTATVPDEPRGMVDLSVGQYLSRKLHVRLGTTAGPIGVLIEGVHLGAAGFKELDGGGDTGFSRNEWMLKGRYDLGQVGETWNELELKAGFSNEDSDETYLGLTQEDFERSPYRRYQASALDHMQWNRTSFTLTHRLRRGADLDVTTAAYRHDHHRIWRRVQGLGGGSITGTLADPDDPRNQIFLGVLRGEVPASTADEAILIGPNDRTFVSQGIQTTMRWRPKTGPFEHRLELGVRAHMDGVDRVATQRRYAIDGGRLVPFDDEVADTVDNEAQTLALAMHALDAVTWKFLTVTGGARVESIRSESDDALDGSSERMTQQVVLPGGGLFVALPADLGAFAGVYQGYSPIPPPASAASVPEKSVNYEFGARWSPRKFRAEVIGFVNDYTNLANVCTLSTGCDPDDLDRQFDAGAALVTGVEAYVESELPLTDDLRIPGRLAYTYTHGEFTSTFDSPDPIFGSVTEGDEVPYVPPHQLAASIGLETDRWGTYLAGTFVDAMREVAGSGEPAPYEHTDANVVFDLAGHVVVVPGVTAYLTARNLFDATYVASHRPFGARPGAPLWIQGGAKLDL